MKPADMRTRVSWKKLFYTHFFLLISDVKRGGNQKWLNNLLQVFSIFSIICLLFFGGMASMTITNMMSLCWDQCAVYILYS